MTRSQMYMLHLTNDRVKFHFVW